MEYGDGRLTVVEGKQFSCLLCKDMVDTVLQTRKGLNIKTM